MATGAGYDNLTPSQDEWFGRLMTMKIGDWPDELREFVKAGRPGCGDHMADLVGQWVKAHSS